MLRPGNFALFERGANLDGRLLFPQMADLNVNGGGTHDDEREIPPRMMIRDCERLVPADLSALDKGRLHSGQTKGESSGTRCFHCDTRGGNRHSWGICQCEA